MYFCSKLILPGTGYVSFMIGHFFFAFPHDYTSHLSPFIYTIPELYVTKPLNKNIPCRSSARLKSLAKCLRSLFWHFTDTSLLLKFYSSNGICHLYKEPRWRSPWCTGNHLLDWAFLLLVSSMSPGGGYPLLTSVLLRAARGKDTFRKLFCI